MPRRVVVVALLLALSACSTSSEAQPGSLPPVTPLASPPASAAPTGTPAPSGPASPSPTASLAPVVKPRAADRADQAGAEAFARYWIDELNAAYDTLDTSRLKAISRATCQTCRNYISSIDEGRREGERYEGGEISVREIVAAPLQGASTSVLVNLDAKEGKAFDHGGRLLETVPEERNSVLNFQLTRASGRWVAVQVARVG